MFELRQIFNIVRLLNYVLKLKFWIIVFYVSREKHVHRSHWGMEFPWNIDSSLSAVCLLDSLKNLYSWLAVSLVQHARHWKQAYYKHSIYPLQSLCTYSASSSRDFRCIALWMHLRAYIIFYIAWQSLYPEGTQFLTLSILGKISRTFDICTTCTKSNPGFKLDTSNIFIVSEMQIHCRFESTNFTPMTSFFGASIELVLLVYTLAKDTSRTHERKIRKLKHISPPTIDTLRFILKLF